MVYGGNNILQHFLIKIKVSRDWQAGDNERNINFNSLRRKKSYPSVGTQRIWGKLYNKKNLIESKQIKGVIGEIHCGKTLQTNNNKYFDPQV